MPTKSTWEETEDTEEDTGMKNVKAMSTDELRDIMQWIADREAYRRTCGIQRPTDYAEESALELKISAEIARRGILA